MSCLRPLMLGFGTVAALVGVEGVDRPEIAVGGFGLVPMANLVHADGTSEWHPKALLGASWNSNVYGRESSPTSDVVGRGIAGLEWRWRAAPAHLVRADAELEHQQYASESALDLTGGRAAVEWAREGPRLTTNVDARIARNQDPLIESGELIVRDEGDVEAAAQWNTLTSRFNGRLFASNVDYREGGRFFNENQRDFVRYGTTLGYGLIRARDSLIFADLRIDRIAYSENTRYADSSGARLLGGWRGLIGVRATLEAGLGVDHRSYGDGAGMPGATTTRPAANLELRWPWEQGSEIRARIESEVIDAASGSGGWSYGGSLDGRYRLRINSHLFGGAGLTRIEGDPDVPGGTDQQRSILSMEAGIAYFLRDGIGSRLRVEFTDSSSSDDVTYQRVILALDFAIVL
ncbi:MAG: hypothetical protein H0W72_08000 [Planctomycetes bacterium]|nr:hypothetical protein [Planctomycetota bacterium]